MSFVLRPGPLFPETFDEEAEVEEEEGEGLLAARVDEGEEEGAILKVGVETCSGWWQELVLVRG